jgi:DNA repair exonuclease SbcCD nuclease subunit
MRIAHFSDSHLGYSAYSKVDEETGLNAREMDFYRAFERCVDRILRVKPDAVLHSGDLFDSVRPTNRAISFALEQMIRISQTGIPVVMIAGNHSTPRLRETGSVFKIFEHLDNVHPVFQEEYERIELGDLAVHALPHCDTERMTNELQRMAPSKGKKNVGMLHAGISSLQIFRMGEFNEAVIPASYLRQDFDYFALGHYHGYSQVTKNSCYSGSLERLSFAEAGDQKGFLIVDLDSKKWKFEALDTRPMIDLPPIDAMGLDAPRLRDEIATTVEARDIKGAIVRMVVKEVNASLYKQIDFNWIASLGTEALHFEPKFELVPQNGSVQWKSSSIGNLQKEYVSFLEQYPLDNVDKDRIRNKGLEYLERGLGESD